jgi:hypothetical protein
MIRWLYFRRGMPSLTPISNWDRVEWWYLAGEAYVYLGRDGIPHNEHEGDPIPTWVLDAIKVSPP